MLNRYKKRSSTRPIYGQNLIAINFYIALTFGTIYLNLNLTPTPRGEIIVKEV